MKTRINILCLCGVVIGVASLFATWVTFAVLMPNDAPVIAGTKSGLDFLTDKEAMDGSLYGMDGWIEEKFHACQVALIIFAAGLAIALITPIGGFVQLAGVLFLYQATQPNEGLHWLHGLGTEVGFTIGFVSSFIVLLSIVIPLGLSLSYRANPIPKRLFTFSRTKPT